MANLVCAGYRCELNHVHACGLVIGTYLGQGISHGLCTSCGEKYNGICPEELSRLVEPNYIKDYLDDWQTIREIHQC